MKKKIKLIILLKFLNSVVKIKKLLGSTVVLIY